MPYVLFDDSLPLLVNAVREALGEDALSAGVVLRDSTGKLSFVAPSPSPADGQRANAEEVARRALGPYARPGGVLIFKDDPGAGPILAEPSRFPIRVGDSFCLVVDRRIVGSGWLERPKELLTGPPRVVFASVKGGVGRSTALAVAAADLSRRNSNVLVVDLDFEAPGLGDLLLDRTRLPRLGSVDFLVENGIGGIPEELLPDFVGLSSLTTGGGGRVDVIPALGSRSIDIPENVLPKLARSMVEDVGEDGYVSSVSSQIAIMLERLTARFSYDVVLIDSRSGLSELAASAILGLGATALLFGNSHQQTLDGYRSLFAGLGLLASRDIAAGHDAYWRLSLKPVYAKASLDESLSAGYRDELYELFANFIYDTESDSEKDVIFSIDDPNAPHWPLVIPFNQNFVDFDPVKLPSQLTQAFYEQTFRPFLNGLDELIESSVEINTPPGT
jgi:hypothetical protein